MKRAEFWDLVRNYLWDCYGMYFSVCMSKVLETKPERQDCLEQLYDRLVSRSHSTIPLTKNYLTTLLNDGLQYGQVRSNLDMLSSAYKGRNK